MAIDPDITPVLDGLEQRVAARIDIVNGRVDEHARHLQTLGNADSAFHAELIALRRRIETLEAGSPPPPPPPPPGFTPKFPGDVPAGKIRWGSSIQGNGDPVARHETTAGVPLGVRRTFWSMAKTSGLLSTARADVTAGRVPWVSVKLGAPWAAVASGSIDTSLLALFGELGKIDGPVWFTAHHEPENDPADGTAADWRNMQARVRAVLDRSGVTNVAFASILMSWTFDRRSGRNPADWHVDGIWDFAGVDHYKDAVGGVVATSAGWPACEAFYAAKGLRIAVGEWGNRGTDAAAAQQMQDGPDHLLSSGSPGASYFDSNLNSSTGGWELTGEPLIRFRELMAASTSVTLR
jgi:hypothetical protein